MFVFLILSYLSFCAILFFLFRMCFRKGSASRCLRELCFPSLVFWPLWRAWLCLPCNHRIPSLRAKSSK